MSDTADTPTQKVQLAYEWTDPDGKVHEPDDVVDVDVTTARQLLDGGRARIPDDQKDDDGPERPTVAPDGTMAVAADETRRTSSGARGSSSKS